LAAATVLGGCFHWVRVDDPAAIRDERVRVVDAGGAAFEIDHACGALSIEGGPGAQPAWSRPCTAVDPTHQRVYVHRFHAWKTATIALSTIVALTATMFGFAAAAASVGGG